MSQRIRLWGKRAGLVCVSLLFTLILLEVGFRLFYPQFGGCEFGMKDEELGWKLIPNHSGICHGYGVVAVVQISAQGFRNPQFQIPKPPNLYRILVLGDSTTFGIGVDASETVPALLESELTQNSSLSRRYEVVNAGVPGYGTAQEWLLYRRWGHDLDPDLVVLLFLTTNDIQDNMCLDRSGSRPCFTLEQNELELTRREVLSNPPPLALPNTSWTLADLHTYFFFRERIGYLVTSNSTIVRSLTRMGFEPDSEKLPPILHSWYQSPYATEGWRLTQALLDAMLTDIQNDSIPLLLVILPGQSQTTEDYSDLVDAIYGHTPEGALFRENPIRPQETLMRWANERDVFAIDTLESLKETASLRSINLPDGHFNAVGNQAIAEEIYSFLNMANLLQDPNTR